MLGEISSILAVGLNDSGLCGSCSMHGTITRVDGDNLGLASCGAHKILGSSWHDDSQVSISAAAMGQVDGTGSGVHFLLKELENCVGGMPGMGVRNDGGI